MTLYYAHSVKDRGKEAWEPLDVHLRLVAEGNDRFPGAAGFAAAFGAEDWGRLVGFWHDLGKYRPEFQEYLFGRHPRVEHAGVGAALARTGKSQSAVPLCFVIAGHHAGLANARSNDTAYGFTESLPTPLLQRLEENLHVLEQLRPTLPAEFANLQLPTALLRFTIDKGVELSRTIEFWTRMLFSVLIDADRMATAAFYAKFEPQLLHDDLHYDSIASLRDRLDLEIDRLTSDTPVNRIRHEILNSCRDAARRSPGRFSLTAPTGGGKTLSAMSFALNHAHPRGAEQRMRRVIVVIPYTSIIEQNAAIYRRILGDDNVLEHHSNLDEMTLEETDFERESRRKLASENWDSPIVVTTSVQFFESLFSNHPSRCRKLHNVAKSVIILDEVQTLPPQLLEPILDGLRELTEHYGCSVLLSTATPPALKKIAERHYGLECVAEILDDPESLARRARRVDVTWEIDEPLSYDALAVRLVKHDQVLAIVHRRRDARELAEMAQSLAPNEPVVHLSALMCPLHRLRVLSQVREALQRNAPCRLIATQLVEAGVDVDFPIVYRALAGLDSLAQAAGRCDREGKLTAANGGRPAGKLIVFRAPTNPPPGVLRKALDSTLTLKGLRGELDLFDPTTCEAYFDELYGKHDLDQHGVQLDRSNLDFATVSAKFRMIDSASRAIVVLYEDAILRVERFRAMPSRKTQRALQPFIVQVSPIHFAKLLAFGAIERIHDRVEVLSQPFRNRYNDKFGLDPDIDGVMDAEVAVV